MTRGKNVREWKFKGNHPLPLSSPAWCVPDREHFLASAKEGPLGPVQTYSEASPAAQHTLATSAAAYAKTTCLGRIPGQDPTTDVAKPQVRPRAARHRPHRPKRPVSERAPLRLLLRLRPVEPAALGRLWGAGTEEAQNCGDAGYLGGDSLADVIGWWKARFRSRLRGGREAADEGRNPAIPAQPRGVSFRMAMSNTLDPVKFLFKVLKQILDHDIPEIACPSQCDESPFCSDPLLKL
ncbi:unnamed protein product [Nyctereutes procyonoides]|uniref:(raccoon dog) hypothetical protein n=1 Tax=Nyctereutes procyonoides TaxID=34880 RepID=A0A811ZKB8_NYCPR|nr:unnamed protein product [Nyctereutes procyonoides]